MEIIREIKKRTPIALKKIVRKVVLSSYAGRNLTVMDGDTFIVSYPKSGNTWIRFLIAHLVYKNEEINFANIEKKVPDIYQNTDGALLKLTQPRIIKSHEYFDPRYNRVICIVRDPRDIVVSYYHHMIKIRVFEEGYPISLFVESFLNGELDPFGSWGENVGGWVGAREGDTSFLLLRYEDMLINTVDELKKIAGFLGIQVSDNDLQNVVVSSSFDNMRSLEEKYSKDWLPTRSSRIDKSFVRSGKSGSWGADLSPEYAEIILKQWHTLMTKFNYE